MMIARNVLAEELQNAVETIHTEILTIVALAIHALSHLL